MSSLRQTSPFELLTSDLPRDDRANQGSEEITVWCPCCLERTIPARNGTCMFCDTPLTEEAIEREALRELPQKTPKTPQRTPKIGRDRTADRAGRAEVARQADEVRIPRRRTRRQRANQPGHGGFTDEQIIARIQLWERCMGSPPAKADWTPAKLKRRAATARGHIERHMRLLALYELGDFPSETTVRTRFGSMNSALVRAGFEPRSAGRQPTTGKGVGKPKIGRDALIDYVEDVQANLDGDQTLLKAGLYRLAMSAFWWADRMPGEETA